MAVAGVDIVGGGMIPPPVVKMLAKLPITVPRVNRGIVIVSRGGGGTGED